MKNVVALLIIVLAGVAGWYVLGHPAYNPISYIENKIHPPCSTPIPYTLGPIDKRFGLTKGEILEKMKESSALWASAEGKELFVYAPDNAQAIPVNFIYDKRQQTLALGSAIDSTEASQQSARTDIEKAQAAYKQAGDIYAQGVDKLNADSAAYSAEVSSVNARGGATKEEYARLAQEKQALQQRQSALQLQATALQKEGVALSQMISEFNAKVKDINQVVQTYNTQAGTDFEEGQYVQDATGKRIDIYAYKSQSELLHTLTHELGHALGIDHNTNPASIMYPYNKSGVTLSADDISSLKKVCGGT